MTYNDDSDVKHSNMRKAASLDDFLNRDPAVLN